MNMMYIIVDLMAYATFAVGMTGAFVLMLLPEYKYGDIERDYDIHPRIK